MPTHALTTWAAMRMNVIIDSYRRTGALSERFAAEAYRSLSSTLQAMQGLNKSRDDARTETVSSFASAFTVRFRLFHAVRFERELQVDREFTRDAHRRSDSTASRA